MNPTDSELIQAVLMVQEHCIAEQEARMDTWVRELQSIFERRGSAITEVGEQIWSLYSSGRPSISASHSFSGSSSSVAPTLTAPAHFSGDCGDCTTFLTQSGIHFKLSAEGSATDCAQVAFAITHLTGCAEAWAAAEWDRQSPLCNFFREFANALHQTFQTVSRR